MAGRTREIHAVAEAGPSTWFVELASEEGDAGHAVGSVYARSTLGPDAAAPPAVLTTNDLLTTLWAAPSGSVWVASATGHVATTARVGVPIAPRASYTSRDPAVPWTATALPPVRGTGVPPNATALWGTSDDQVFVGTYGGHVYAWEGRAWTQVYDGPGGGDGTVRAFGGTGPHDVLAVGDDGVVLHFDGRAWRLVQIPGAPVGGEVFTGLHALGDGTVVLAATGLRSGTGSRLLKRTADGWVEWATTPLPLLALVGLGERVLFATGEGVAELFGAEVRTIKATFRTATAWPGIGRVYFVEPEQPVPAFVEHDPGRPDRPWFRRKH